MYNFNILSLFLCNCILASVAYFDVQCYLPSAMLIKTFRLCFYACQRKRSLTETCGLHQSKSNMDPSEHTYIYQSWDILLGGATYVDDPG